jgi:hypothetical protein
MNYTAKIGREWGRGKDRIESTLWDKRGGEDDREMGVGFETCVNGGKTKRYRRSTGIFIGGTNGYIFLSTPTVKDDIEGDAEQWRGGNTYKPIEEKGASVISSSNEGEGDANNCVNDCENNFKHGCSFYFLANIVIIL